jgi:hypothetical protein
MSDWRDIPEEAESLLAALERLDGDEDRLVADFASTLRTILPIPEDARQPLARTLFIPTSLADDWVGDTAELFDRAAELVVDDEVVGLLVDRLSVLRWAWGAPPESWPPERSEEVRADWRADLDRVLT